LPDKYQETMPLTTIQPSDYVRDSRTVINDNFTYLEALIANIGSVVSSTIFVDNETPTGTIDGTNRVFTLANAPVGASLQLFVNGLLQTVGVHYTLSGTIVTFLPGFKPEATAIMRAFYRKV
jgi:hypothetical protein